MLCVTVFFPTECITQENVFCIVLFLLRQGWWKGTATPSLLCVARRSRGSMHATWPTLWLSKACLDISHANSFCPPFLVDHPGQRLRRRHWRTDDCYSLCWWSTNPHQQLCRTGPQALASSSLLAKRMHRRVRLFYAASEWLKVMFVLREQWSAGDLNWKINSVC